MYLIVGNYWTEFDSLRFKFGNIFKPNVHVLVLPTFSLINKKRLVSLFVWRPVWEHFAHMKTSPYTNCSSLLSTFGVWTERDLIVSHLQLQYTKDCVDNLKKLIRVVFTNPICINPCGYLSNTCKPYTISTQTSSPQQRLGRGYR